MPRGNSSKPGLQRRGHGLVWRRTGGIFMRHRHVLLAATVLAFAAPAAAGPTEDFKALTDDYWAFTLRENPTFASSLGVRDYDDQLGDISLAAEDRRAAAAAQYLARLEAISDAGLTPA